MWGGCPLTDGVLAIMNLQAQIDGQQRQMMVLGSVAIGDQAKLIELVALRGQLLGRVVDYEWADERAEQLVRDGPSDPAAFISRARARSRFHRFAEALADFDHARRLGADSTLVDIERASVFQAIGDYDPALKTYQDAAKHRADFASLSALACLHAERGEIAIAEQFFNESRDLYHGVSPFPLAMLDFQHGLMWLEQGDLQKALVWFEASVHWLPGYVPARGHLAEVEAALEKRDAAITRLLPLAISSDDPDYAASLARILMEADREEEASKWRDKAAARYDELMARHPEAFADHAAEFWLEASADPRRALQYARVNLEVRRTRRAHQLLQRASFQAGNAAG